MKSFLFYGANLKTISFVLPAITKGPVGGHKIIFQYANLLAKKGYDITIYFEQGYPLEKYPIPKLIRLLFIKTKVHNAPVWFTLNPTITVKGIDKITNQSIQDADCIVATAFRTAEPIYNLSKSKGNKFYFIQGFETWAANEKDLNNSYALGMHNIVISSWLKKIVDEASSQPSYLIPNPIDLSVFCNLNIERNKHEVAVLYHEDPHKGFMDSYKALLLVKEKIPDLTVNAFGACEKADYFPSWFKYTQNASEQDLQRIYNQSSIYLCGSKNDGFGLTCLESMACGCTLVSTDFLGVHEYAKDGINALLSPVGDAHKLAENIIYAFSNPDIALRISSNATLSAQSFDLERSSELLMHAIESYQ